ncbi:MAG TPA: protein-glutamate O-methyltransferase CheR [Thermoflexia bacterium]|nr:protein-glutamate O-methyltransferase CheR [Thermoflexia bacterium]
MSESEKSPADEERVFDALLAHIRRERRLDCSQYKESFLRRRLTVRMRARDVDTYQAYLGVLRSDPAEFDALLVALTINLSYFFRDTAVFEALRYAVLETLVAKRAQSRRLTVWSAGCAGGEEPCSVAMILTDLLGTAISKWDVQIQATDIDANVLARARRGVYKPLSFQDLQAGFVERYFTHDGDTYTLQPAIRRLVTFRQHDLTTPPPLPRYDLILCRNVLIYFAREYQESIVRHLLDYLEPGGYLTLGMAEMLPLALSSRLEAVDGRLRIYRKMKE